MNYLQQILPKTVSNKYSGPLIPLYVFYLITSISIARSLIHIFSQDGGAGSIATIPINDYVNGGKEAVVFMFAMWGLGQLLMGIFYAIVSIKYKSLLPLMYIFIFLEYFGAFLIGQYKGLATEGTPPGAIGAQILMPLSIMMLIWILNGSHESRRIRN
ncbi:MAG: hypothetical protein QY330_00220 [Candidatus Dojkabacteria bacterium]|nr:MAG: hypothetical protein QY330_00220 [Candidatus Dojkabacteria bacterium]